MASVNDVKCYIKCNGMALKDIFVTQFSLLYSKYQHCWHLASINRILTYGIVNKGALDVILQHNFHGIQSLLIVLNPNFHVLWQQFSCCSTTTTTTSLDTLARTTCSVTLHSSAVQSIANGTVSSVPWVSEDVTTNVFCVCINEKKKSYYVYYFTCFFFQMAAKLFIRQYKGLGFDLCIYFIQNLTLIPIKVFLSDHILRMAFLILQ